MTAGFEVLRRIAEEGEPAVTVRLVNWADEEGARFGRSLFGSSAAAGSMADQDELRQRRDADGKPRPQALAEQGVDLELHIERPTRWRTPRSSSSRSARSPSARAAAPSARWAASSQTSRPSG